MVMARHRSFHVLKERQKLKLKVIEKRDPLSFFM